MLRVWINNIIHDYYHDIYLRITDHLYFLCNANVPVDGLYRMDLCGILDLYRDCVYSAVLSETESWYLVGVWRKTDLLII